MIAAPGSGPEAGCSPPEAVLLDAHGTLLELEPPVPRLRAALAREGHRHDEASVGAALAAEIRHYRRHMDRGRDAPSLAALRLECAEVLAAALGGRAPAPARTAEILVDSLRFRLFPDALPALDALGRAGVALAVVSNWDHGLADVLERLGVADRFGAVVASATAGAAKPDAAIFHAALARLGVPPARALHCGDLPAKDCLGARRAGLTAVLIDRAGALADGPCPRVRTLVELADLALAGDTRRQVTEG